MIQIKKILARGKKTLWNNFKFEVHSRKLESHRKVGRRWNRFKLSKERFCYFLFYSCSNRHIKINVIIFFTYTKHCVCVCVCDVTTALKKIFLDNLMKKNHSTQLRAYDNSSSWTHKLTYTSHLSYAITKWCFVFHFICENCLCLLLLFVLHFIFPEMAER